MHGKPCQRDWEAKVVFLIQIPLTFGGRYNRYFWDTKLKLHKLLDFNVLFQLLLTKFVKSELFSWLPKVDNVIKSCKEPTANGRFTFKHTCIKESTESFVVHLQPGVNKKFVKPRYFDFTIWWRHCENHLYYKVAWLSKIAWYCANRVRLTSIMSVMCIKYYFHFHLSVPLLHATSGYIKSNFFGFRWAKWVVFSLVMQLNMLTDLITRCHENLPCADEIQSFKVRSVSIASCFTTFESLIQHSSF